MNSRQKEILQAQLNEEKKVLKQLEEMYKEALLEINSKIEILMARQDADLQHVIYQVEYQKALKTQIQAILEQLHAKEFETVSEYLAEAYEDGFIGTMYDLQGQGVPLVFPIDQAQIVAAIQTETKLSENLYTTLGRDVNDLQKKIAGEISRGISTGMMYSEMARNISGYARIPKNNAMRIARTEAHRIQCKATADAQFKAKEHGADVVKQWDASLDKKTRKSHRELDGQIRELEDEFEVGSHKAMHPGAFGIASEDINCRCALLQRARWALEDDIPATKWSPDAPVLIDDDGTTQFVDISDAKNYQDFKDKYKQSAERVQRNAQKMKNVKNPLENDGKTTYNGGIPRKWKELDAIEDDAVKNANPHFGDRTKEGYDDNCPNCVCAYEMRKRGHKVIARPSTKNHHLNHYPEDAWVNPKVFETTGSGLNDIMEIMNGSEEGSRFQIAVDLAGYKNKGHVFVAERKNGKNTFYDPQNGKEISEEYFDYVKEGNTKVWQIDNLEPSDRCITACESE